MRLASEAVNGKANRDSRFAMPRRFATLYNVANGARLPAKLIRFACQRRGTQSSSTHETRRRLSHVLSSVFCQVVCPQPSDLAQHTDWCVKIPPSINDATTMFEWYALRSQPWPWPWPWQLRLTLGCLITLLALPAVARYQWHRAGSDHLSWETVGLL